MVTCSVARCGSNRAVLKEKKLAGGQQVSVGGGYVVGDGLCTYIHQMGVNGRMGIKISGIQLG